ncbi:hypothetical protein LCGC14_3049610, partial [marine sediment metagenome]
GQDRMAASRYEQDLAAQKGVRLVFNAQPVAVHGNGAAQAVEFEYTADGPDGLRPTGERFRLEADQVFKAIGQRLEGAPDGLRIEGGKIVVSETGRSALPLVWAGGDDAAGGDERDGGKGGAMTKREILFEIRLAAKAMLRLEKKLGHHGVFAAIREWMKSGL